MCVCGGGGGGEGADVVEVNTRGLTSGVIIPSDCRGTALQFEGVGGNLMWERGGEGEG